MIFRLKMKFQGIVELKFNTEDLLYQKDEFVFKEILCKLINGSEIVDKVNLLKLM